MTAPLSANRDSALSQPTGDSVQYTPSEPRDPTQPLIPAAREEVFKDLSYTTSVYFGGEQLFPTWEGLYAAIVGGLVVAFFSTKDHPAQLVFCIVGILFATQWCFLTWRNHLYSKARFEVMERLAKVLHDDQLEGLPGGLFDVFEKQRAELEKHRWLFADSWLIRKLLPLEMLLVWVSLAAYLALTWSSGR